MKLLILQLSDLHLKNKEDAFSVDVDKIVQSLNAIDDADECVIVISGDLAFSGKDCEYKATGSLLGAIIKKLVITKFQHKYIEIICVPGNHDIDFTGINREFDIISNAVASHNIDEILRNDLDHMKPFYSFANHYDCFKGDKIISKKIITKPTGEVGFVMINSAPFSFMGGDAKDMGLHYLTDKQLELLDSATEADINILIMHHSIEWFSNECKERIRKIIGKKYSFVLTGHEHEAIGETRNTNETGKIQYIQGNALLGYSQMGNGFCTIILDLNSSKVKAHSFLLKGKYYVPEEVLADDIKRTVRGEIAVKQLFLDSLKYDNNKYLIDDYYVFPNMVYNQLDKKEELENFEISNESVLEEVLTNNERVFIYGERKSGKTLLANRIYSAFISKSKCPILFNANDLSLKKIDRIIKYTFEEQYEQADISYRIFEQLDLEEKIAIIDEAELLDKATLNKILNYFENKFCKILVFSEEQLDFDIHKQVLEVFAGKKSIQITIKPFWYTKRKELILNTLKMQSNHINDINQQVKKINDIINSQIKYFNLNPEFIINFVNQYMKDYRFQFMSGTNVFSVVYENSVRNRIIDNSENMDVNIVLNILREIAYYMHFGKKVHIQMEEVNNIINQYEKDYRQKVNVRQFLNIAINAKIIIDNVNYYRFKDHTLVAYFVAQAINQKFNQDENIAENVEYLLNNLCFSINSDIVLFLALITNNPKFINFIVNGAYKHFAEMEELDFDKGNVKFIMDTDIPIKNSLPSTDEKKQRETALAKQEEEAKLSDLIELVNEYDYSEEDLKKVENQIMISFKYIEILSKTLPAFCHNLKADQQDRLVEMIYKCPNKFLYAMLKDINDNFDEFVNTLYEEVSEMRKEKNIAEVNLNSIKKMIEQIASLLIITLYQLVADTAASDQTTAALNAFDWISNSNYKIMNLIMLSKNDNISVFSKRAIDLDKVFQKKIEKAIVKFSVRNYFLNHDVEMYGEGQQLFDYFFGEKGKKNTQLEFAKNRLSKKDRI